MKKILIIQTILIACLLGSCNFLNVDDYFDDTFKEDEIFDSKINIERYFNGAVNMSPREGRIYYWTSTPGATGSDEAVSPGSYTGILTIDFPGTNLTTDQITYTNMSGWQWNFYVWSDCYKVIRKVNTILPNIDQVPDMTAFEKMELRAQARFLRAYAYYWILQNHGPFIILGDEIKETNEDPEYYRAVRNTYDECVDYLCAEFEAAAEGLEVTQPVDLFGAPTRGAALALVARIRLTAASPLFNGGAAAKKYYGNFTRKTDGVHYISQEYDDRKWALAAAAAKKVMDMKLYDLHTIPFDPETTYPWPAVVDSLALPFPDGPGNVDPFRSYSEMFTGETVPTRNKELIWGSTSIYSTGDNLSDQMDVVFPLQLGGNSVISIPQRIVDSYLMADGETIYTSSDEYPYENSPYDSDCITDDDIQLSLNYVLPAQTYKAYANREPRFYASIAFSGTRWRMESTTESRYKQQVVEYYNGGPNGKNTTTNNLYNLTGYTCFKYVHPRDARTGSGARTIAKTFPLIRYAEILLIYAEALNNIKEGPHEVEGENYSRDEQKIGEAFNQVRYRAGLRGITKDDVDSPEDFQEILQRERLVEFLHENRRYYDICRWGIWEDLEKQPLTGMNVDLGKWNGFYSPTVINHRTIRERVWKPKYMLLPLHRNELRKVPTLDQNPGWEE